MAKAAMKRADRDELRRASFARRRGEVRPLERLRQWARVDGLPSRVVVAWQTGAFVTDRPERRSSEVLVKLVRGHGRPHVSARLSLALVEGGTMSSDAAVQLAAQMCLDKLRTARPGGRERWRDEQLGPVVEPARVRGMVGESPASFVDWLMGLR